jgi:Tfp pilus assembly protein PilF
MLHVFKAAGIRMRQRHVLSHLLPALVSLLMLLQVARAVDYANQPDVLQRADMRFASGQYYTALQQYRALSHQQDTAALRLRLGILHTLRGEFALAEQKLWHAMLLEPSCADYELTTLYLGHVVASREQVPRALEIWQRPAVCAIPPEQRPYAGPRRVIQAEWALRQGEYGTAQAGYSTAITMTLPADWQAFTLYRLALLQAASDPDGALELLESPLSTVATQPDPFLTPLLPTTFVRDSSQLYAVLQASDAERPQLLGQLYLNLEYYDLAERQFAQVPPDSPYALSAATYAAYAEWHTGEEQAAAEQLEQLVTHHPGELRVHVLQALTTISSDTLTSTATLTSTVGMLPTWHADTYLARALWYVAQSDYVNASLSYQQAIDLAPAPMRGHYALVAAQFHLRTTYELCAEGLPVAQEASSQLTASAEAWTTLAAIRYQCSDFAGATIAAHHALTLDPQRAAAFFYRGAALARLNRLDEARITLIHAADLAPASIWRERAELVLDELPPDQFANTH